MSRATSEYARLQADVGRAVLTLRSPLRLDDLTAGEVRAADVAHLPGADEAVEGRHGLLDRSVIVPRVHLVEVDVVGAEATETRLEGSGQVAAGQARVVRAASLRAAALRREHDRVAFGSDGSTDDRFRLTARVHVRGVDEVVAGVEEFVDDATCLGLVARRGVTGPEVHGAETGGAHFQTRVSQCRVGRHRVFPQWICVGAFLTGRAHRSSARPPSGQAGGLGFSGCWRGGPARRRRRLQGHR